MAEQPPRPLAARWSAGRQAGRQRPCKRKKNQPLHSIFLLFFFWSGLTSVFSRRNYLLSIQDVISQARRRRRSLDNNFSARSLPSFLPRSLSFSHSLASQTPPPPPERKKEKEEVQGRGRGGYRETRKAACCSCLLFLLFPLVLSAPLGLQGESSSQRASSLLLHLSKPHSESSHQPTRAYLPSNSGALWLAS